MNRLTLYLKGSFYEEIEINPPNHDDELDFESNSKLRELYVEFQSAQLRTMKIKQILKCEQNYSIYVTLSSKANMMEFSEEDMEAFESQVQLAKSKSLRYGTK